MNEFIEKLISRLEEEHARCVNAYGIVGGNRPAMEVTQCINIVNELAEEYKGGWIPCSERLPEEYGEYLCVNKYGNYILGYPYRNKADEDLIMVETDNEILLDVIAWQPLPKPYTEGE